MIHVALFDDHTERREAMSLLLGLQPDMALTGAFENCAGLPECLAAAPPDVVLMDIDMPGVDGIEGVRRIRHHFPQALVVMQTVFEEDGKIFDSILAGAHGYILKKTSPDKLVAAIRDVVDGGVPMTASIARRTLDLFRTAQPQPALAEAHGLSPREHQILTLLVGGYSHKMIAAELAISPFTVNNHIRKVYSKLAVHSATEAVSAAMKRGIVR